MKKKFVSTCISVLFSLMFLTRCETESSGSGDPSVQNQFDGTYLNYYEKCNGHGSVVISGNTEIHRYEIFEPNYRMKSEKTYDVQVVGMYGDAQMIDSTILKHVITLCNKTTVDVWNNTSEYGFNDWTIDVPKDVTDSDVGSGNRTDYNIRVLKNNRIYYGSPSGKYDGKNPETRMKAIDYVGNEAYTKSVVHESHNGNYSTYANNWNVLLSSSITETEETFSWEQFDENSRISSTAIYRIEDAGDFLDGQKINKTLIKQTITLKSQETVTAWNDSNTYGFNDWELNVAKDVTSSDEFDKNTLYTIRVLINNRIYEGKPTEAYDGSSPERRLTVFDLNRLDPLTKSIQHSDHDGSYSYYIMEHDVSVTKTIAGEKETIQWERFDGTRIESEETYSVVDSGDYLDGQMINKTLIKKVMTIKSQATVDLWNSNAEYGYTDWALNTPKDVTASDSVNKDTCYTIRVLLNGRIHEGIASKIFNGRSPNTRMKIYNLTSSL